MRLSSLTIESLPGIDEPIEIPHVARDVNVVTGPNASGKSSIVRAVEALLYPETHRREDIRVSGVFDDNGTELHAKRRYDDVTWSSNGEPTEAPTPPEHRHFGSYRLAIEDLDDTGASEQDLAMQLIKDFAGGYNLREVRSRPAFDLKRSHGKSESAELRNAKARLRDKRLERQNLKQQEDRLEQLEQQKTDAVEARTEVQAYQDALDLLEARRDTASIRDALEAYPPDMDRLRGTEADTLDECLTKQAEQSADIRDLEGKLADARDKLTKSGLEHTELTEGDIRERRGRIDQLRNAETKRDDLAGRATAALADLAEAARGLGRSEVAEDVHVDPETVRNVESLLRQRQPIQVEIDRAKLDLSELPSPTEKLEDENELRAGEQDLTRWLNNRPSKRPTLTIALLGAVLVVALAGAAMDLTLAQQVTGGTVALLLVIVLTGILLAGRPDRQGANEARRSYETRPIPQPAQWEERPVRALATQLRERQRLAEQYDRRTKLERLLTDLMQKHEPLNAELRRTSADLGFDGNELGADFARWLALAHRLDRARRDVAHVNARLEEAESRTEELHAPILDFLASHGEAPTTTRANADVLRQRLDALADRLNERDTANQTVNEISRRLARQKDERGELQKNTRILLAAVRLGDREIATAARELRDRQDQHDSWRNRQTDLAGAEGIERDRARKLEGWDALKQLVDRNDKSTLERGLDAAKKTAGRADKITKDISDIEADVRKAQQERELERLEAARSQAESELARKLREALLARAGRLLLDQTEAEYQQESQPALLQDAKRLFTTFTRNQYELKFDPDADVPFYAMDTGMAEKRTLDQLSTGTRAQLLLATRTAFAHQAERGRARLPFFLDEALTTSDAERFKEVVSSLRSAATEDDRQLFYLTARPEDIPLWETRDGTRPHAIDLAESRTLGPSAGDAPAFATPTPPTIPQPDGRTPEEYAVTIGVPAIDPWADPAVIHLFHLLRDDLSMLHRLMTAGVQRLGHLRTLLNGQAARLLTQDERARLAARSAGTEAWITGWRIGRGRPVSRTALLESGAVSEKYVDQATDIVTKARGDASKLLEAIDAKDLKGFHASKRDELKAFFLDEGYLVRQDRLTGEWLRLRILDVLAEHEGAQDLESTGAEATMLASWCETGVALGT